MDSQKIIHKHRPLDHEDDRRTIKTAFNGDIPGFSAKQVKILQTKKDTVLGGHYHTYRELFYLLKGEAIVYLSEINMKQIDTVVLKEGDMLFIPKEVAHKFSITKDSILIGCTEKEYLSAKENDHPFDLKISDQ